MNLRNITFWIFTTVTILFSFFLSISSLTEWWTVAIKKQIGAYPWGHINDNPWYYDSPTIYSRVMLTEFFLLTAPLGLTIFFAFKGQKTKTLYLSLGLWLLIIIFLLNGQTQ